MRCKVQYIYKNPRYRLLIIDGDTYIMDISPSIWKIFIPFLIWLLPNTIYKIDERDIEEKINTFSKQSTEGMQQSKEKNNRGTLIIGLASVSTGSLLASLSYYFESGLSSLTSFCLSLSVIILLISLRLYLSSQNKKKFYKNITLDKASTKSIWIRPNTIKSGFVCLGAYLFSLIGGIVSSLVFIESGNLSMLICSTVFFVFLVMINIIAVLEGTTKVKFKEKI
ncbi:DUF443 family protein [Oceanobacillus sp. J11TS1]|nr:DUF443 family protein [Oceanobacillus sp. J11TS1]